MRNSILSVKQRLVLKLYEKGKNWSKEHRLPGGNIDRSVYIIRRSGTKLGLFSYVETTLARIDYAYRNNLIPVVDMCNFKNSLKESDDHNPWEDYFEQPGGISLQEAYKSKKIILSESGIPEKRPNESMLISANCEQLDYWRDCFQKYVRINDKVKNHADMIRKKIFSEDDNVLGVLARGTDYLKLKPSGHPVQPEGEEILKEVKNKVKEEKYTKIFLATEDRDIAHLFKEEFGDMCVEGSSSYIDYQSGYLAENKVNTKDRTLEYMTNMVILSQCDGIVAGRTSGTVGAAVMSKGWKDSYFFDLGLYE